MSAHLKKQIASAEEYEKVTIRISQNWTTIANAMKFDVMNSGLIKGLKWLDEFMEKWKKAAQAVAEVGRRQRRAAWHRNARHPRQ